MQITIELPPDLEQDLRHQAAQSNLPLQALILQALHQLTQSNSDSNTSQWSDIILDYEGIPDFPPFESYREDLLPPSEPKLF
ncbi:hypothetical protein [Dactylococcopsis salina]|uniref:Uncharacterized protein n=1 Tax=Dactylococcopsis salina (strain PCC 8305) TaxID=13035 RepID=K9YRU1_DACS8|nr:hypothetical protein [Dactylococcopsis salina]AFZ49075.1 hypothetical protein Dacsa_0268 [Dactylococcopsis salina PCC 8305]